MQKMKCLLLILSRSCANNKVKDIPVFVVERRGGGYRGSRYCKGVFCGWRRRLGGGIRARKAYGPELHKRVFHAEISTENSKFGGERLRCML
jgi:hypothetical protein